MASKYRRETGKGRLAGFTLVELLVSTAIMLVVILVLLQVIAGMTNIWHNSTGTVSSFQNARAAFTAMTRTLARATLNNYVDYANSTGGQVNLANSFATVNSTTTANTATNLARMSELHFVCGNTASLATLAGGTVPTTINFPGSSVFFQAPLGVVSNSTNKLLSKSVNDVAFFVEYSDLATSAGSPTATPDWLGKALGLGGRVPTYKYRLVQFVQSAETEFVYGWSTNSPMKYQFGWFNYMILQPATASGSVVGGGVLDANTSSFVAAQENVLAENIPLLILRPRLEPQNEATVAAVLGTAYNSSTANSIISPNYVYDSRAWAPSYNNYNASNVKSTAYAGFMRNQLPPIVDVVMVAVDGNSLVHYGAAPNTAPFPAAMDSSTIFNGTSNSANLDADLTKYENQLAAAKIRFRTFRASIQMESSAWVNSTR